MTASSKTMEVGLRPLALQAGRRRAFRREGDGGAARDMKAPVNSLEFFSEILFEQYP